jgi:CrcB protein
MAEMLCVAAGGFAGAVARYAASRWVSARFPSRFPLGTLLVNVLGSFLLGWIVGAGVDERWVLLLGTGFMGAFTTFSTLNVEMVNLFRNGAWKIGLQYAGLTLVLGIGAAWCGLALGMPS